MAARVAIGEFRRIERPAFRQMLGTEGYGVVAINNLTDPKMLAHLLKYNTAQGGYAGVYGQGLRTVEAGEDFVAVDGRKVTAYREPKAANLPQNEVNVGMVLKCIGFYCSKDKAQAHIGAGTKEVVISTPAGNNFPTTVYNVDENVLTASGRIISAASYTISCLAPMAKILSDYISIRDDIMSTIHAYTDDQMILDESRGKGNSKRARAGAANVVPNSTGVVRAVGLVVPELNGELVGSTQRVPVPTGSTIILTAVVKKAGVTRGDTNATIKATASESLGCNEDAIVSSDIIGMRFGSLFDAAQIMVAQIADDLHEVWVVS